MRRVVVTGLGLVTPLGVGVEPVWKRLLAGDSGLGPIEYFDPGDWPCRVAGQLPRTDGTGGGAEAGDAVFNPDDWVDAKEQRRVDPFIVYAIAAAEQAVRDADWRPTDQDELERTGVIVGSGIGGLPGIEEASIQLKERGLKKLSPFFIPGRLINLTSGYISIRFGYKGPNHSVVTACSTGAHAIGDGARLIAYGDADVMVAGGAEGAISPIGIGGFIACRALSTHFNDTPEKASRPYDEDRDGFVMGEGAGVVVLEEYEHAKARGATIYGEVKGYGLSGDAYHITAPAEDGDGGFRSMKMALDRAGLAPKDIDYINAHGTSTPKGDEIELGAVERLFGDAAENGVVMSSTKSSIGHLLGAAGSVEAIFGLLAMRDGVCPPTINLDNPSVETPLNLAPHQPVKKDVRAVLSNSFGFGGTNASVVLTRVDE